MEKEQMSFPTQSSVAETRHKRMGHFFHRGLLYMQNKGLAKGFPPLEEELPSCEAFQFGK